MHQSWLRLHLVFKSHITISVLYSVPFIWNSIIQMVLRQSYFSYQWIAMNFDFGHELFIYFRFYVNPCNANFKIKTIKDHKEFKITFFQLPIEKFYGFRKCPITILDPRCYFRVIFVHSWIINIAYICIGIYM